VGGGGSGAGARYMAVQQFVNWAIQSVIWAFGPRSSDAFPFCSFRFMFPVLFRFLRYVL
jgi:hypothetical protein